MFSEYPKSGDTLGLVSAIYLTLVKFLTSVALTFPF